jgi:hypothetical protein
VATRRREFCIEARVERFSAEKKKGAPARARQVQEEKLAAAVTGGLHGQA